MAKFVRRHPDASGSHTIIVREREVSGKPELEKIVITGREVYETDDKKEIEILMNDPEIMELTKKTKIEVQ